MPNQRNRQRRSQNGNERYRVAEDAALPAWAADAALSIVGRAHPRAGGSEKVTGRARYAGDLRLPRQLCVRVLRSPHPHARIRRIDTARAAALPGVHAVISAANAPEMPWFEDSLLFDRTVRFVGEEVAAVAAETEELAEDALRLIAVEYDPLPFVPDLAAALRADAPRLRPSGNIASQQRQGRGDIEAGFRDADVIVEGVYATPAALHNCLEPHGCTAWWEGDQLTLWTSTQGVFRVRSIVAQKLAIPENRVRVVAQHVGGAFGSKQGAWKLDLIAALLAQRTGRPVQLLLDREAENLAAGNRNATRQWVRLGARRDGALTAIQADLALETGAYQVGGEASDVAGVYLSLYRCPNVGMTLTAWYTNTGPACAFRAPGYVEGAFALEQAMDELAQRLGLDPLDLRLRNYAEADQQRGRSYSRPESLRACYEQAAAAFGWRQRRRPPAAGPKRRGSGIAAHNWVGGAGSPPAYAWVKLNADGSADVITGTQDIGTGTRTGLAQVAAEELGLPLDQVRLHLGDTAAGPYAPPSWGSATQAAVGPAVRAAAAEAKRQLLEMAAHVLEQPAERLSVRDGQIWLAGQDRAVSTVAAITGEIAPHMILGQGARGPNPRALPSQARTPRLCPALTAV
ncbi:MAG: xanthine dehydrogenase family protein molybdopterin-binding subunit [Chloroflexi bacterium]|nr:xanthine dehydrogenase family protein molybdopterin-binding subunit [Chloroflexota bacterium]